MRNGRPYIYGRFWVNESIIPVCIHADQGDLGATGFRRRHLGLGLVRPEPPSGKFLQVDLLLTNATSSGRCLEPVRVAISPCQVRPTIGDTTDAREFAWSHDVMWRWLIVSRFEEDRIDGIWSGQWWPDSPTRTHSRNGPGMVPEWSRNGTGMVPEWSGPSMVPGWSN